MVRFWIIAFSILIFHTLKNRSWHMVYVDMDVDDDNGKPRRKQLIAKKHLGSLDIYWQDLKGK